MTVTELKRHKPSLGRGLSALLGESIVPEESHQKIETLEVDIQLIRPGKYQPRYHFNDEKLTSLIDSIRQKGIIQPLVIRPLHDYNPDNPQSGIGPYEIIAGERRWRAAKTLNLNSVPAIIRPCSDQEALETALIENVQRDDLSPIEEADGYQRLMTEFNYTQEELSKSIGKSRSHVANTLRLMQLPQHIKDMINEGKISAGHARTLLTAPNMEELLHDIINNGLTVRETEKRAKKTTEKPKMDIPPSDVEIQSKQLETQIADLLNMQVNLKITKNGGTLSIFFHSYEEIDDLIEKLRYMSQS